jgi:hypothetical protein
VAHHHDRRPHHLRHLVSALLIGHTEMD